MNNILSLTILSLAFAWGFGADDAQPSKLPQKALKSLQAAEEAIGKTYSTEVNKLVKELEKEKVEATKAGNLDAALAISDLEKEIDAGKIFKDAADAIQQNLLDTPFNIIGTWNYALGTSHGTLTIDKKNNASLSDGDMGIYDEKMKQIRWSNGTFWQVIITAPGKYSVKASDGVSELKK